MLFGRRNLKIFGADREAMHRACQFNAQVMDYLRTLVRPGVTTGELDRLVHQYTLDHGHKPACLNYPNPNSKYPPYPKVICTSVNEVVCHGIPGPYELQSGDIVNIDLTTIVDGWHGDSSETFLVGEVSDKARAVTQCAFDCMWKAIDALKPGSRIAEIGRAIVAEARPRGFSVVREYVGHGVGRRFHQDPTIPHYPTDQSRRERLEPGICFTIEPMINEGTRLTTLDKRDGWTVRTKDGKLTAQFEHTVLMTEDGPLPLTLTKNGPQRGHKF